MFRKIVFAAMMLFGSNSIVAAGELNYLGHGRIFNNDYIGDGHDRWRTGNIAASYVWGSKWAGKLPERYGDLLEFRFNAELISPQNLANPAPGDRPFAGVLSFGLHSHFLYGDTDIAAGADLVFTGPQTGMDDLQDWIHDLTSGEDPAASVRATQIGDDVFPSIVFEAGRDFDIVGNGRVRPFFEFRWGVEDLIRAGADFTFGSAGVGGLMVRDPVTGHRYNIIRGQHSGHSFLVGADLALVSDSEFLPETAVLMQEGARTRVRAGAHWQNNRGTHLFYGLTWLSKEFEGQPEEQVVGSLRLGFKF